MKSQIFKKIISVSIFPQIILLMIILGCGSYEDEGGSEAQGVEVTENESISISSELTISGRNPEGYMDGEWDKYPDEEGGPFSGKLYIIKKLVVDVAILDGHWEPWGWPGDGGAIFGEVYNVDGDLLGSLEGFYYFSDGHNKGTYQGFLVNNKKEPVGEIKGDWIRDITDRKGTFNGQWILD